MTSQLPAAIGGDRSLAARQLWGWVLVMTSRVSGCARECEATSPGSMQLSSNVMVFPLSSLSLAIRLRTWPIYTL